MWRLNTVYSLQNQTKVITGKQICVRRDRLMDLQTNSVILYSALTFEAGTSKTVQLHSYIIIISTHKRNKFGFYISRSNYAKNL